MEEADAELNFKIAGMDCASCAITLESSIGQMKGVDKAQVNFTTATLTTIGDIAPDAIVKRVRALGYEVVIEEEGVSQQFTDPQLRGILGFVRYLMVDRHTAVAIAGTLLLLISVPISLYLEANWAYWAAVSLHIVIAVLVGYPIVVKGIRSFALTRQITIDLLMSIATLGAFLIGETGEGATVILLFAIGEALEGYTTERARDSIRGLMSLAPNQATVLRPCLDCEEHLGRDGYKSGPCPFCGWHEIVVPVEEIQVGNVVLVRPGETIPIDGYVVSGTSSVNQAPITGESTPISKSEGDMVFAGTINGEAVLEITVTQLVNDTTLSRIVRLVEQAQTKRSPIERFVDRFARWYTPAVVLMAIMVAIIPPLFFGASFLDTSDGIRGWLYRALALLIVACPCALVISTPVTVASSLTSLARRGILVKGGAFLDALARIRTFAFDKTGTLTEGQPMVTQVRALGCLSDRTRCDACDDMLALASAVERRSEHPLARAIMLETNARNLAHRYAPAESVYALSGQGIQGIMGDSMVTVGSHALFHELYTECSELHPHVEAAEAHGQTVMMVSRGESVLGFISVADKLRHTSRNALRALKELDPDTRIVMLTGDNPVTALEIARNVEQIDEVRAELLPEDKVIAIRELQSRYGPVAMIGDGINDAPALATATIGVAMGGAGTAQAMETADVVLMQDDLTRLPDTIHTSKLARRIIRQNIVFSLIIKAAFLLLTLPGWATLWMAVFADMGASILVTLNGLRMLRTSPLKSDDSVDVSR